MNAPLDGRKVGRVIDLSSGRLRIDDLIHVDAQTDHHLNSDGGEQVLVDSGPMILQTPARRRSFVSAPNVNMNYCSVLSSHNKRRVRPPIFYYVDISRWLMKCSTFLLLSVWRSDRMPSRKKLSKMDMKNAICWRSDDLAHVSGRRFDRIESSSKDFK